MENTSWSSQEDSPRGNLSGSEFETPHAPTLTTSGIIRALVLIILAFWSLLGNLVTLQNASHQQKGRSHIHRIYTLIVQLAISDIFVTIFCITGEAIWMLTVEWKGGNSLCKLFKFLQMFSLYLSTFIMTLIGIDRFISVRFPLKVLSKEVCNGCIGGCWVMAILLSLPQLYVFRVNRAPFIEPFYQCVTFGAYAHRWEEQLYAIFSICTMFLIPLGILGSTYILTIYTLHQTEEVLTEVPVFKATFNPKRKEIIHRAKIKSLRLSITIIITFLIFWSPYYALMIISIFTEMFGGDDEHRSQIDTESPILDWIFFFGMSNSLCNPIIYGIFVLWKPQAEEGSQGGLESSRARATRTLPPPNPRPIIMVGGARGGRNGKSKKRIHIREPCDGNLPLELTPSPSTVTNPSSLPQGKKRASSGPSSHERPSTDNIGSCPETETSDKSPTWSTSNPEFCREMEQWFEIAKNERLKPKQNGSSLLSLKSFSSGSKKVPEKRSYSSDPSSERPRNEENSF